jgi:hypothetical protein
MQRKRVEYLPPRSPSRRLGRFIIHARPFCWITIHTRYPTIICHRRTSHPHSHGRADEDEARAKSSIGLGECSYTGVKGCESAEEADDLADLGESMPFSASMGVGVRGTAMADDGGIAAPVYEHSPSPMDDFALASSSSGSSAPDEGDEEEEKLEMGDHHRHYSVREWASG